MTAIARNPGIERQWAETLARVSLDLRFEAMLELARAGVLAAVGLDLRTAFELAADASMPGMWRKAEGLLELTDATTDTPSDEAWSAWITFCARSQPTDIADYRDVLDERYAR